MTDQKNPHVKPVHFRGNGAVNMRGWDTPKHEFG